MVALENEYKLVELEVFEGCFASIHKGSSGLRKEDWCGSRYMGAGDKYRVDKTMWEEVNLQGESEKWKEKRAGKQTHVKKWGKGMSLVVQQS